MPYKDPSAQREYQRQWKAARRAEYLADKACVICSSRDRMEIDHIDKTAKVSHRIWTWSEVRRKAELAKCQVLCHDHHLEKTLAERPKAQHGSGAMYQKPNRCRCPECRAWKAVSDKKYRG